MEDQVLYIPMEDKDAIILELQKGLQEGYQWLGWDPQHQLLGLPGIYCIKDENLARDFCWDPHTDLKTHAVKLLPAFDLITRALAEADRNPAAADELLAVPLAGLESAHPEKSAHQTNFEHLQRLLGRMDALDADTEHQLINGIKSGGSSFTIHITTKLDGQLMQAAILLEGTPERKYDLSGITVRSVTALKSQIEAIENDITNWDWTEDNFKRYTSYRNQEARESAERILLNKPPSQFLPIRSDFIPTINQAFSLYQGRSAYLPVPGNVFGGHAWFTLGRETDEQGNRLLLQLHDSHDFPLRQSLLSHNIFESLSDDRLAAMETGLRNGEVIRATQIQAPHETIYLLADPVARAVIRAETPGIEPPRPAEGLYSGKPSMVSYAAAYDANLSRLHAGPGHPGAEPDIPLQRPIIGRKKI